MSYILDSIVSIVFLQMEIVPNKAAKEPLLGNVIASGKPFSHFTVQIYVILQLEITTF